MNEKTIVPRPVTTLSYSFLKQKGIEYVQQLAGKIWTDYNEHDPGITILEELCYAILDLDYRTKFLCGFEQSYSDSNPTPYVDCKVIYKVRDSDEGRKLFKAAQDLVNDPILKADYPRETLTIMQTATDGNTPTRPPVNMSDCVVKKAEIDLDIKEGISIGLVIHGLYNKPQK